MVKDGPTDVQFEPPSDGGAGFELAVVRGASAGRSLVVSASTPSRTLVGQSPACALVVDDRLVSRRHLAVEVKGAELRIEDLGSTNGTFVGSLRVERALLRGGEHVTLGETVLSVTRVAATEPRAPLGRGFGGIVGSSLAMRRLYPSMERVAASDATVLVEGETGTGKELFAETIHALGPRREGPFVVLDCAALPPGHGAAAILGDASRAGVFETAHGGTLVLDEVGELSVDLQPLLLRAIERGEVQRVGDPRAITVSVRVVATTRRDLEKAIQDGTFRDDLFYRLAALRIELPPLRERDGDIGILARHFWRALGGAPSAIPYEAFEALERAPYPGNVRELQAAVTRLLTLGAPDELPAAMATSLRDFCADDVPYVRAKERLLRTFEAEYVATMVKRHGTVERAAAASGLALRYFQVLRAKAAARNAT